MNKLSAIESVNQIASFSKSKGIAHLSVDNNSIDGNRLHINGTEKVNFGSCSYLGLEFEPEMIYGAKHQLDQYGTQFSASRAYISVDMYEVLENKLEQIFGGHVVVTPTTTLGHIATIPILVDKNDAIVMDHQVHNSVQTAVKLVKCDGTHVELVRHNRLDLLEKKIIELSKRHDQIWYMADGIYSMYGDKAPLNELEVLLNKYENFHLYVDDAHAMSCFGKNGKGYTLSEISLHERMVVGTSLNKAFAAGGGAFVFPNKEMAVRVKNCGGPMITSGPMQPAALGAAVASADIHLSDKIYQYQDELMANILFCHDLLEEYGLPNLAEKESPIFFVGAGLPKVGFSLVSKMMDAGFVVNIGIFPAVPMKNTGIRFTITRLHTFQEIKSMVQTLASFYFETLDENDFSIESVCKAFKIEIPELSTKLKVDLVQNSTGLIVKRHNSISEINGYEWDQHLGTRGALDSKSLGLLENSFKDNSLSQDNWSFKYLIVKDKNGQVILSTFFTSGLIKDDMLSDPKISRDMEICRVSDPYFCTSKFVMMGSLITEGNHLYIDRFHSSLQSALELLIKEIEKLQIEFDASTIILRDLDSDDKLLDDFMIDHGYFKVNLPESFSLDLSGWKDNDQFLEILSKRSKKHFKQNVRRFIDKYEVKLVSNPTENELQQFYELYLNVQQKGMEMNSFPFPFKFFKEMGQNENWDIIALHLKQTDEISHKPAVGVVFAYRGKTTYVGGVVGIDYEHNKIYGVYRQAIYQFILQARKLGYQHLDFGFCAGIEKKKFGAKGHSTCAYMQVKDNFVFEAMLVDSGKSIETVNV